MAQSIWEMFLTLFRQGKETSEEKEEGRFVPSPLDLSIRVGHGGPDDEIARELSKIDDQAQELEEKQREN